MPLRPDRNAAPVSATVIAALGSGWHASTSETATPWGFPDLMRRSIDQEPPDSPDFARSGPLNNV
jgi:hypothetical protein